MKLFKSGISFPEHTPIEKLGLMPWQKRYLKELQKKGDPLVESITATPLQAQRIKNVVSEAENWTPKQALNILKKAGVNVRNPSYQLVQRGRPSAAGLEKYASRYITYKGVRLSAAAVKKFAVYCRIHEIEEITPSVSRFQHGNVLTLLESKVRDARFGEKLEKALLERGIPPTEVSALVNPREKYTPKSSRTRVTQGWRSTRYVSLLLLERELGRKITPGEERALDASIYEPSNVKQFKALAKDVLEGRMGHFKSGRKTQTPSSWPEHASIKELGLMPWQEQYLRSLQKKGDPLVESITKTPLHWKKINKMFSEAENWPAELALNILKAGGVDVRNAHYKLLKRNGRLSVDGLRRIAAHYKMYGMHGVKVPKSRLQSGRGTLLALLEEKARDALAKENLREALSKRKIPEDKISAIVNPREKYPPKSSRTRATMGGPFRRWVSLLLLERELGGQIKKGQEFALDASIDSNKVGNIGQFKALVKDLLENRRTAEPGHWTQLPARRKNIPLWQSNPKEFGRQVKSGLSKLLAVRRETQKNVRQRFMDKIDSALAFREEKRSAQAEAELRLQQLAAKMESRRKKEEAAKARELAKLEKAKEIASKEGVTVKEPQQQQPAPQLKPKGDRIKKIIEEMNKKKKPKADRKKIRDKHIAQEELLRVLKQQEGSGGGGSGRGPHYDVE